MEDGDNGEEGGEYRETGTHDGLTFRSDMTTEMAAVLIPDSKGSGVLLF